MNRTGLLVPHAAFYWSPGRRRELWSPLDPRMSWSTPCVESWEWEKYTHSENMVERLIYTIVLLCESGLKPTGETLPLSRFAQWGKHGKDHGIQSHKTLNDTNLGWLTQRSAVQLIKWWYEDMKFISRAALFLFNMFMSILPLHLKEKKTTVIS